MSKLNFIDYELVEKTESLNDIPEGSLNNVKAIDFYEPEYDITYLVISDLHILPEEPKNRNNLIPFIFTLLDEIYEISINNKVTGIIFLGDIFDRSFSKVSTKYISNIINIFKKLSSKFELYTVYGNHELTYTKDNPFYMITEIQSEIVLNQIVNKDIPELIYPYIKLVDKLEFESVDINFVHFQKVNKSYNRTNDTNKNNICLYHDSLVSFESKEKLYHHSIGNGINIINSNIFENVDWAICGDTHTPLNSLVIGNRRQTVFDVPGVMMCRTISDKHSNVKCPIIKINNKGYKRDYVTLNIGRLEHTIDKDIVEKETEKKKIAKVTKKIKRSNEYKKSSYSDFVNSLPTKEERDLLYIDGIVDRKVNINGLMVEDFSLNDLFCTLQETPTIHKTNNGLVLESELLFNKLRMEW